MESNLKKVVSMIRRIDRFDCAKSHLSFIDMTLLTIAEYFPP